MTNSTAVDPITVSVVQHRLHAIAEEMGEAMLRTSYSQIINSSRDFSTALCDAEGRLIAQAEHVPIHVGALPWAARSVHDAFRGSIRPGDVFLLNDPYHGGNHLPDLTAFVPVFDGERLAFWSINRSHQSDIGGATHGAYNPGATEIFQEGIRIPPLRLYEQGVLRADVMAMIVLNVRHPREFQGDLAAMIGSARVGERRMLALLAELGSATTHAAIEAVLDGAERQVRTVIATWADGVYHGEAVLDDDGHGAIDIHIRAKVTKRGSDLEVDLSHSDPQVTGFVNSSFANMRSAVVVALAYLIDPETPKNDGAFRPVSVIAKEGTVVWAKPGAPVTLCTNHCGQEIIEAIIKALAPACPGAGDGGLGAALSDRDPGHRPAQRPAVHLAPVPGAPGRRRLDRRRRLACGRRVAGGGRHQVRQPRGRRGALPPVLPTPRVPARQRRRRPLPRRPRRPARDGDRGGRARRRQHRRRRRAPRRLRHAGRRGRPAASLCAEVGRTARPRAQDQGGRRRDPAGRCPRRPLRRWRRLRPARRAQRPRARPRHPPRLRDRGAGPRCCGSGSTSAAPSPTWWRSTTRAA